MVVAQIEDITVFNAVEISKLLKSKIPANIS